MPVVGVIEPGARAALAATRNRKVGVIGTEGTIASGSYTRALRALDPGLEIYTRACPLFVALAEEGWVENEIAQQAAAMYLASLRQSRIDTLVLGCTHYPLLAKTIGAYLGPGGAARRLRRPRRRARSRRRSPPTVSRRRAARDRRRSS